jgi:endonuclease/exonuclease/phosphatase family metal-dependent hydrolase
MKARPTEAPRRLRIATWNPRGGLGGRTKLNAARQAFLESMNFDLIVLPEYGRGGMSGNHAIYQDLRNGVKRGIGIVARLGTLHKSDENDRLPSVVAAEWTYAPGLPPIKLLALWATDYKSRCLITSWFALDRWLDWLATGPSMILGDFNQSPVWDAEEPLNFTDIIIRLESAGFKSCYHSFYGEEYGSETHKTFRCFRGSFHIDYIFCSSSFRIRDVEIFESPSDHSFILSKIDIGEL